MTRNHVLRTFFLIIAEFAIIKFLHMSDYADKADLLFFDSGSDLVELI